jgi:hypothetical protein
MANVYDHIQEREARKDRTTALTNRPERDLGGDGPRATPDQGAPNNRGVLGDWGGGNPRDRGVLWDGAKVKPSWRQIPKTPLAPTLDQVRGYPQMTEPPVNQRPDVNPLTARAPRNPFGPPPFAPPVVPGWGGPLTQARPVGPLGPQATYVPGLMPWSNPGPWSGAPIAPEIPRGQRFNPGAPVPSPFDPTGILRSVSGPRQGPIGWAQKVPGIFDQQRGRVTADPLRPDRRTKLAPDIEHAVLMGYIPDPRGVKIKFAARPGGPGKGVRGGLAAKHTEWVDPHPNSGITQQARQRFHEIESMPTKASPEGGYAAINMAEGNGAHGRYQLTDKAFMELGMVDGDGNWIEDNRYGVKSRAEFRENPLVQEQALEDILPIYANNLRNEGPDGVKPPESGQIMMVVDGEKKAVRVTSDSMIAAAHRRGAHNVRHYIEYVAENGPITDWGLVPGKFVQIFQEIEERLWNFEDIVIFGE